MWYSHLTRDTGVAAERKYINMIKNMIIATLAAVVAFLALEDGNGVLSVQEMGMPVFAGLISLFIMMMVDGIK
jgi:hypothetical protein